MEGASREGEYHLGLLSVGYSVVEATVVLNTTGLTMAKLQATPNHPNYLTLEICGNVVHSLGQEPGAWFALPFGPTTMSKRSLTLHHVTADNSACYVYGSALDSASGAQGLQVRVVAIAP
jgi:hypothetical protein